MGRLRKKPEYNTSKKLEEQVGEVAFFYGSAYDDRLPDDENHISLREVADQFEITILKVRKILITAGMYSTYLSRQVQRLSESGKTILEIMEITGLSRASVHSYLPYSKDIYNMPERSVDADRKKLQRSRERACKEFVVSLPYRTPQEREEILWGLIELHEGCIFNTVSGLRYKYKVIDGEICIDVKKENITKMSVMQAMNKSIELSSIVSDPRRLGINGSSYVYPILVRFGLIKKRSNFKNYCIPRKFLLLSLS